LDFRATFRKEERISNQKEIDRLFAQGSSFLTYPLRVVYVKKKPFSGADVSILVSIPKKRFKQAVKRNRLKRLVRESYRLHKQPLIQFLQEKEAGLLIAFLFIGKDLCEYKTIETAVVQALDKLKGKCNETTN
jgi:ribonuclease P protein component